MKYNQEENKKYHQWPTNNTSNIISIITLDIKAKKQWLFSGNQRQIGVARNGLIHYTTLSRLYKSNQMKKKLVYLMLLLFTTGLLLQSCSSSRHCTTKATNRGGGYYINR